MSQQVPLQIFQMAYFLQHGLHIEKKCQSLPSTNKVWAKVMFLHLSINHSVHEEGVSVPLHAGIDTPS